MSLFLHIQNVQLKFVKLCELGEFGKRIHDGFVGYAVGDPDEARAAESGAGDQEDVELLGGLGESRIVFRRSLHEEIEGAFGFDAGEAEFGKAQVERFAVPVVIGDVGLFLEAFRDGQLHEAGGVHEAQDAVGDGHGGKELFEVIHFAGNNDVA